MDCRDVREIADSYLSGELLIESNHEVLRHLATCPTCRAEVASRRDLRDSVRRSFQNAADLAPRPEFVAALQDRLRKATPDRPAWRAHLGRGWWALAATLVLGVALAALFGRHALILSSRTLAQLAVGDHRNCALKFRLDETPISLDEAAQRYGAVYRVLQELPPDDLMTAAGPAHVLERHSCVYGGRRFAHLVIQYRGALVSLLVTLDDRSLPSALRDDALAQVTTEGRIDGVSLVSFRTDRYAVFLAGELDEADLMRLADVTAGPLRRQLSGV